MSYVTSSLSSRRRTGAVVGIVAMVAWVLLAVAVTVFATPDCAEIAKPAASISKAIGDAISRTNEQPGTGYIRDPRQ